MATYALRDAVNLAAIEWPVEYGDLARAGVTPLASINAPCPRVEESPAHFEWWCLSAHWLQGNSNHGWVDVVYGEVERIHTSDEVTIRDGKIDITQIRPLALLSYYDYTSVTDVFEIRIAGASGLAAAGLRVESATPID